MMRTDYRRAVPLMFLAALWIASCARRSDVEELRSGQKDILAKLDQIEKKIGQRPPAQPPRPRRPDPNATYKVELGKAPWKGASDAKVTVVEWSDFQ